MSRIIFIVLFCNLFVVITGCGIQRVSNSWKKTKKFYGDYINTPACINYADKGSLKQKEIILASRMMDIDIRIEELKRYLQNADKPPSDESVSALLHAFPWLSGVVLLEPDGTILAQEPDELLQQSDLSTIMEAKPRGEMLRSIRGAIQNTTVGPKIFLAVPIYVDSEMKALFVVYFDINKLSSYSPYSNDLIVFSPDIPIWTGQFSFEDTPLFGKDWQSTLRSFVSGEESNKDGSFFWLAHFIGRQEIIFATPVSGKFFEVTDKCFIEIKNDSKVDVPVSPINN